MPPHAPIKKGRTNCYHDNEYHQIQHMFNFHCCVPCFSADFRSIELRLLAHLSGDPVLINTLNSRQSSDVFILLASEWYTTYFIVLPV